MDTNTLGDQNSTIQLRSKVTPLVPTVIPSMSTTDHLKNTISALLRLQDIQSSLLTLSINHHHRRCGCARVHLTWLAQRPGWTIATIRRDTILFKLLSGKL